MPMTKFEVEDTFHEVLSVCRGKYGSNRSKKVCSRAALTMKTELMDRGIINAKNVASVANVVDQECAKSAKGDRKVCMRAVATFIRRLASRKPGLNGRKRR
jgi:hypothetical protein